MTETPAPESGGSESGQSANSEAAKFRRKLREAEASLETANTRVAAFLRREVERAVSDRISVPADIFDLGKHDAAEFFGEGDELDTEKLSGAVDALLEARPGLARPKQTSWGDPFAGIPTGGGGSGSRSGLTWRDALRPQR